MKKLNIPIPINVDGVVYVDYIPYHIKLSIERTIPKGAIPIEKADREKKIIYKLDKESIMRYSKLTQIDKNILYSRMIKCELYDKLTNICSRTGTTCKGNLILRKCPLDKHIL